MDQEALFKAVDEGRADKVFFADATDGQPSCEVVGKDAQDHGEGVRQVGRGRWFIVRGRIGDGECENPPLFHLVNMTLTLLNEKSTMKEM